MSNLFPGDLDDDNETNKKIGNRSFEIDKYVMMLRTGLSKIERTETTTRIVNLSQANLMSEFASVKYFEFCDMVNLKS